MLKNKFNFKKCYFLTKIFNFFALPNFLSKKEYGFGFTLIEVLVAIGMLGGMILTVSYMNVANLAEIRRHTAESYADLIAEQQFSALFALRNHQELDRRASTRFRTTIASFVERGTKFYINISGGDLKIIPISQEQKINKVLKQDSTITFYYFLEFSKLNKSGTENEKNIWKVHLRVQWKDRGQDKQKDYYTLVGDYLNFL